jgi:hypothetical protein
MGWKGRHQAGGKMWVGRLKEDRKGQERRRSIMSIHMGEETVDILILYDSRIWWTALAFEVAVAWA